MENSQVAETTAKSILKNTRRRRRMNLDFINLQEGPFIGKVIGNFTKKFSQDWESDFITMELLRETDGETVIVVLDGGLRGALKQAGIIEGTVIFGDDGKNRKEIIDFKLGVLKPEAVIEIVHEGKIEVTDGKANKYAVYLLEN